MYLDPQHCFLLTVMRLSWLVTNKVNFIVPNQPKEALQYCLYGQVSECFT